MNNAGGWVVTVKLSDGKVQDIYSKKRDRQQAHDDVKSFCGEKFGRVVTSVKA